MIGEEDRCRVLKTEGLEGRALSPRRRTDGPTTPFTSELDPDPEDRFED